MVSFQVTCYFLGRYFSSSFLLFFGGDIRPLIFQILYHMSISDSFWFVGPKMPKVSPECNWKGGGTEVPLPGKLGVDHAQGHLWEQPLAFVCFTWSRLLTECDRPGFSTLHTWHGRHIWRGTELWAKIFLVRGNSQTNPARLALPLLGLNWRL